MHHLLTEEVGLGLGIGRVQIIPEEESVNLADLIPTYEVSCSLAVK